MSTAKIFQLLNGLSPTYFRKLGKMVRSPFFTTNDNLVALYKYLQPYYPSFDAPQLEKQRVFKKIFPKHVYSDIKMRNLLREMTRLVEDLMIFQKLESEDFTRKKMLAEIYHQQKLDKFFNGKMYQLHHLLNEQPYRDGPFFEAAFKLNVLEMEHIESSDLKKRTNLLEEALSDLEQYYQLTKINLEAERKVFSRLWPSPLIDPQVSTAPILLQIYQKIMALLETRELDLFFEIRRLLFDQSSFIRHAQQLNILLYLINFAVSKMRLDDQYYNTLAFELYQWGIEHKVLIQDGHISDHTFLNTCIAGAKAGAFDWTMAFIKDYEPLLSEYSRDNIKKLGLSNIYFHQGNFIVAIELLDQARFTNPLQYITARLHTLRCYYELSIQDGSYLETFIDQTHAFEQLIRRNKKFSPEKRRSYFNFTQFIRRLANRRSIENLDQKTQDSFFKMLEKQKITISRSWLIEKISS